MPRMTIGGNIPAALFEEFLGTIDAIGATVGRHDGAWLDAERLREDLDESGHLRLVAEQFGDLERWCVANDIPFDRHGSDGNVCFRPGMRCAEKLPPERCDEALLDSDNIRPLAKELAKLVTVRLSRAKVLAAAVKIIRHLNAILPPELPPLEIGE